MLGRYGVKSGIDPGTLWPTKRDIDLGKLLYKYLSIHSGLFRDNVLSEKKTIFPRASLR